MKSVGYIFIILGFILILFVVYSFWKSSNKLLSPVPIDNGVEVIFVTPKK